MTCKNKDGQCGKSWCDCERVDANKRAAGLDAPECPACKTSAKMIRHGDEWVCHGTHVRTNNQSNTPAPEPRKEKQ